MVGHAARLVVGFVFFSAAAHAQSSNRTSPLPVAESAGVAGAAQATAPPNYTLVPEDDTPPPSMTGKRSWYGMPVPEDDTPPPSTTKKRRWYGWQTLAFDVPALTLVALATSMEDGESATVPFSLGLPMYVFGAPFVHAAHHRPGIAAASFGMRLGAPFVVGFLGALASTDDCDGEMYCGLDEAITFAVVGMGLAAALDAIALAHEKPKPARPEGVAILSVAPSVDARRGAASLSVHGRF